MNIEYHYPKNLKKKYMGSILEKKKKYIFFIDNTKHKVSEEFVFSDYPSKEDAYQEAVNYKIDWNIKNDTIKNKFRYVNDYVLVNLNNDKFMKIDKDDLRFIERYNWKLQNKITYPTTFIPLVKRKKEDVDLAFLTFHEVAIGHRNVNHINNDKLDYRRKNIELVTEHKKNWKNNYLNRPLSSNNSSGFNGVYKVKTGEYEYWQVRGHNYNGKKINKKFSVLKLGDMNAKSQAINYRDKYIDNSYCVKKPLK